MSSPELSPPVNVAARLSAYAAAHPEQLGVVMPQGKNSDSSYRYRSITFRELDQLSDRLARGLREHGALSGMRLALLVKPSVEFVALVFAMLKAGVVSILIDPGMGARNAARCLAEAEPEGFVALPLAQAVRVLFRRRFPRARLNVTVGRRWFWRGATYESLCGGAWSGPQLAATRGNDPAAIIFTTGSTGPSKGVLYRHSNFDQQVVELQQHYAIAPGGIDLACFPLFGLFNAAMGITTVIPDMNPTSPARVDPRKIIAAVQDWQITQSFASPAVWNRVGSYCVAHSVRLPSLRRVYSAGAPVPPRVLEAMQATIAADGEIATPYGATEALPVASITAREVLSETRARWAAGAGTCVGRRFPGIEWRVIEIVDGPLKSLADVRACPQGEIGELIVRGPVVTREYVTRRESNATGKIIDGSTIWHRMGDVGYLDEHDRFWFCGRMAHRVVTSEGTHFTDPVEGIFNQHPQVFRSALVGVGKRGQQQPIVVIEPEREAWPSTNAARQKLFDELRALGAAHTATRGFDRFLLHRSFPVDIRHNAKIFRERLAVWAARQANS